MSSPKQVLRTKIKDVLKQVSSNTIETQSAHVLESLIKLPQYRGAKKIAVFMNMPDSEIQTLDIIQRCFSDNKRVFLPKCCSLRNKPDVPKTFDTQRSYLEMLEMADFQAVLDLQPQGKYKLLEPTAGRNALEEDGLDMIILPGVAFTRNLERMGHGAGFYDDYISRHMMLLAKTPFLLAIGLKEQLVDSIPNESHDKKVNAVVIDGEVII